MVPRRRNISAFQEQDRKVKLFAFAPHLSLSIFGVHFLLEFLDSLSFDFEADDSFVRG